MLLFNYYVVPQPAPFTATALQVTSKPPSVPSAEPKLVPSKVGIPPIKQSVEEPKSRN